MPWARFEDRFPSNRKIRKLDDAAFRLYVSAICWSSENLTDGVVEADDLPLVSDVRQPSDAVQTLVRLGLWEELSGGWFIHDYFEYNPTAEQVRADRALKTARQQRWRERSRTKDETQNVDASTGGLQTRRETVPRPVPSRPVVLPSEVPTTSSSPATPDDRQSDPPTTKTRRRQSRAPVTDPGAFTAFWKAYPRRGSPAAAEKAWNRALAEGADPALIIAAASFYALERKMQDPKYTKLPATWLNARCWEDEPDPAYIPPPVVAATSGHPHDELGGDAHMARFIARSKARKAAGEAFL
jgi:hypothetical protein